MKRRLLEIRSAARDPGLRSKIAVKANDQRLDLSVLVFGMLAWFTSLQAVNSRVSRAKRVGYRVMELWSLHQFVINAMGAS